MQAPCLIKKKRKKKLALWQLWQRTKKRKKKRSQQGIQERKIIITTAQPFVVVLKTWLNMKNRLMKRNDVGCCEK